MNAHAIIHPDVVIGDDSHIWSYATVGTRTRIGKNCVVGSNVYIGRDCVIGDGTRIQTGVFLPNGSVIGRAVFIGPNATFCDDLHPRAGNTGYKAEPPVVCDNVSIGAGAVILPGVVLEEGCIVGAGAVVTKRVPKYVTVVGNPAIAAPDMKRQTIIFDKICRMFKSALEEWGV